MTWIQFTIYYPRSMPRSEWKRAHHGWDLEEEIAKAKEAIGPDASVKEYQRILKGFFSSMEDYHAVAHFYSTETATLPFEIRSAGGYYYLTKVDRAEWPKEAHKIQAGDQLVTFNGEPIAQAVEDFRKLEFHGNSATECALSELLFTTRLGVLGHVVPEGEVEVGIRHKGERRVVKYTLPWEHELDMFSKEKELSQKTMLSPWGKVFDISLDNQSYVPTLGKVIWEADKFQYFRCLHF